MADEKPKQDQKMEGQKQPAKAEEKKAEKKVEIKKKNYAFANGRGMRLSGKVAAHIMDAIRYKKIDDAINAKNLSSLSNIANIKNVTDQAKD